MSPHCCRCWEAQPPSLPRIRVFHHRRYRLSRSFSNPLWGPWSRSTGPRAQVPNFIFSPLLLLLTCPITILPPKMNYSNMIDEKRMRVRPPFHPPLSSCIPLKHPPARLHPRHPHLHHRRHLHHRHQPLRPHHREAQASQARPRPKRPPQRPRSPLRQAPRPRRPLPLLLPPRPLPGPPPLPRLGPARHPARV